MGLHSKHGGDSIQRDAEGHGALGTQAARSHTSGKMPNSWDGAEPSPRHRTEQEHPHPRRERWAAPSLHACSQEAAGPSFSRGRAVQCRAGGCRAGAVRRLGQLPMDAEDTVPHGELSPFCPFTDQVHGLVAPMTAAIVHLSVPFTAVNPAPKRAHTHTHTGQGVSSRAPGRRSNRAALTKGWQEPRTPGALTMNLKCPGFFQ